MNDSTQPTHDSVEAVARRLARWIGYSWDGLGDRSVVDRGFPEWAPDGRYQGGQTDLKRIAAELLAAQPPAAPETTPQSGEITATRSDNHTNIVAASRSSAEIGEQPIARAHVTLEDDGPCARLEVLNGEALQPSMSPVDLYSRPGLQVPAYEIAMTLALSYGRDPDEPAPILEMCDENNQPVPIWMVYIEQAEALLAAYSIAKKPSKRVTALQALADIDRDLIGHDETMANLNALKVRR